jgi:hypothetical protein
LVAGQKSVASIVEVAKLTDMLCFGNLFKTLTGTLLKRTFGLKLITRLADCGLSSGLFRLSEPQISQDLLMFRPGIVEYFAGNLLVSSCQILVQLPLFFGD